MKALTLSYLMGWPLHHVRVNTATSEQMRTYTEALKSWRERHEEERSRERHTTSNQ